VVMTSQDTEVECLYVVLVHIVEEGPLMSEAGSFAFRFG